MARLPGNVVRLSGTVPGMRRSAALRFAAEGAIVAGGDRIEDTARETLDLIAGDEAAYITGANPVIDGGSSAVLPAGQTMIEET